MLILKFWPPYPLFCETKIFQDLAALSGNLAILIICYQSISRPKKPREPNFQVILTLSLGFTAIFRFFRKNFNGRYFRFAFSQFLYHRNSISSYSFQDIEMRFAAFYSQLNWLQFVGNRILNFCPKNFLEPSKVKIFFFKIFFDFGGL